MKFLTRPAEERDLEQIFEHACQLSMRTGTPQPEFSLTREKLANWLFGNDKDWYGLVIDGADGKIAACCLYCFTNINRSFNVSGCLFIDILFVERLYRKKGLGGLIIDRLIEIAKTQKIARIELCCMKDNEDSIRFYESKGAVKVDLLDVYKITI